MQRCHACLHDYPLAEGICCGGGHFACNSCANEYVAARLQPEALTASGGAFPCWAAACAHTLREAALERALEKSTYVALSRALLWLQFDCLRERAAAEGARAAALRAAEALPAEARARAARLALAERDLLLRCPRCDVAFVDYEACNSLRCHRCGAGFCAVCLADCGACADAHIAGSAACGPSPFNVPLFKAATRARYLARIVAGVEELARAPGGGAPLQRAVVAELGRDLRDLGIAEAEVLAGAGLWACALCSLVNGRAAAACAACGAWRCRTCGLVNGEGARACGACGAWRCSCSLVNDGAAAQCKACGRGAPGGGKGVEGGAAADAGGGGGGGGGR